LTLAQNYNDFLLGAEVVTSLKGACMINRISEDLLKHHLLDKTYEKNLLKIYYFQGTFQHMNQSTKHIAVVCIAQQYIM
jgi:hypothetical protein